MNRNNWEFLWSSTHSFNDSRFGCLNGGGFVSNSNLNPLKDTASDLRPKQAMGSILMANSKDSVNSNTVPHIWSKQKEKKRKNN